MHLFPYHSEVLVSTLERDELLNRIQKVTRDVNFLDYMDRENQNYDFNGVFGEDSFRISLMIRKADSFLPLVKGRVEETSHGSILFLDYSLFPGAVFFLAFWTIVSFLLGLLFLVSMEEQGVGVLCFFLGAANYVFAWSHFKRKVKDSQKIFHALINAPKTERR